MAAVMEPVKLQGRRLATAGQHAIVEAVTLFDRRLRRFTADGVRESIA